MRGFEFCQSTRLSLGTSPPCRSGPCSPTLHRPELGGIGHRLRDDVRQRTVVAVACLLWYSQGIVKTRGRAPYLTNALVTLMTDCPDCGNVRIRGCDAGVKPGWR